MLRYYLTPQMQVEWEANGELAKIKVLNIGGPAEIITVTPEQYLLIENLREAVARSKGLALHGPKFNEEPLKLLMYSMESADSAMKKARRINPECSLFEATEILQNSKELPYSLGWEGSLDFFNEVASALVSGDEEFFRNVAEVLHRGLNTGPCDRWTIYIQKAYFELLGRVPGIIPTKKQVREPATFKHAVDDVWERTNKSAYKDKQSFVDANDKAIKARVKQIIEFNPNKIHKAWTGRFQRAGLSDLPTNRGGQPTHRKPS